MALIRNTPRIVELGNYNDLPVLAGAMIFEGAAVGITSAGFTRELNLTDTFAGFADAQANNRLGDDGDIKVRVRKQGHVVLDIDEAVNQSSVGAPVYALGNDQYSLAGILKVGVVERVDGARAVVQFGPDGKPLRTPDLSSTYRFEGAQKLFTLRDLGHATANFTIENQFDFPAPFSGVKLGYYNPTVVSNCSISALSASAAPAGNSLANELTWVPAKVGGVAISSVAPLLLPPQGVALDTNYQVAFTDILPVSSIERSDNSSKGYLLRVRTYAPYDGAGTPMVQVDPTVYQAWNTKFGTELRASSVNGEHTTDGTATGVDTRHWTSLIVVPQYLCPVYNIALTGASSQDGTGSEFAQAANWLYRACRELSNKDFVYSPYNFARGSTTFATSLQDAFNLLESDHISFSAIIHRAGSGNSGWTNANIKTFKEGLIRLYNACREKGVMLIIDQVSPSYLVGGSQSIFMAHRQWVQDTFGNLPYVRIHDSYAAVVDPNDPAKLDPQYSRDPANNDIHFNDAGWAKIAQDITIPLLRSFR